MELGLSAGSSTGGRRLTEAVSLNLGSDYVAELGSGRAWDDQVRLRLPRRHGHAITAGADPDATGPLRFSLVAGRCCRLPRLRRIRKQPRCRRTLWRPPPSSWGCTRR